MANTQSLSLLPRNGHSVPFVELRQSLPSKVAAISPFVGHLMRFVLYFRRADGGEIDIEMALREALANAVIHGNGDDSCKSVYVTCRCYMDGEVSITVRDQGRGFDGNAVPDPTFPENLLFTHCRGIYLIKTNGRSLFRRGWVYCTDAKELQLCYNPTEEIRMTSKLARHAPGGPGH
jgi:anti-sigma regulatory factor (Ser/Thr protein kinase)